MKFTNALRNSSKLEFKFQWVKDRRKKISTTKAESILASKGVKIVDMKDVTRPAFEEEPYTPPLVEEKIIPKDKPLRYLISNLFIPLQDLAQCQVLTKSLAFDSLPEEVLAKVESNPEEEELLENIVLKSHLLDGELTKLPHQLDVHNLPGYKPARKYGIPIIKKIYSLLNHMVLSIDKTNNNMDTRHLLHDSASKVFLNHTDGLMQMNHECNLLVCSEKILKPIVNSEEVTSFDGSTLPDLSPLSPFVHCPSSSQYHEEEEFAVPVDAMAPHTAIFFYTNFKGLVTQANFCGPSLVYAFSLAASYAKEREKGAMQDLKKPVRVNVVHTNGIMFQFGVFQLNTLDFSSSRKNLFWYEQCTPIFEQVDYEYARPFVKGLNSRPYQLLKAFLK